VKFSRVRRVFGLLKVPLQGLFGVLSGVPFVQEFLHHLETPPFVFTKPLDNGSDNCDKRESGPKKFRSATSPRQNPEAKEVNWRSFGCRGHFLIEGGCHEAI
jgi:hypothetical protein